MRCGWAKMIHDESRAPFERQNVAVPDGIEKRFLE